MRRAGRVPGTPAVVVVAFLVAVTLAGCGSGRGDEEGADQEGEALTLTVFAAASLTQSFTEIAEEFEAARPGVTVRLSFGGSSDLVSQIQAGAPADVFASADTTNMEKAGGLAVAPEAFASNTLQIVVPPGNPARVTSLADLTRDDVRLVVCAPEVPCGAAAVRVGNAAGVDLDPVSQEQAVTDVLGKVVAGEADAGLVYVTDVTGAGGTVEGITFPEAAGAVNTYPISVLQDAQDAALAQEFVEFVTGDVGRRILDAAGFGAP